MPFSLFDYRNIPSSGVIPAVDLLPADQFSFAYAFIYEKDVNPDEGFSSDFNTHITLQIHDSAGALKATFDAFETYHVLLFSMAPGLAFYTWNWDINKEKFTATDGARNPITTDGAFGLGAIPASDSGTTDRTAIVSSTFYSPIFNLDLEEGDTLKITFHNASAGFVTDKASLKIATRQSETREAALFDARTGAQFRAFSKNGETRLFYSRHSESPLELERTENHLVVSEPLKGLAVAHGGGGALYILGKSKTSLKLFRSFNEGEQSVEIMSVSADITPLASCLSKDGATFFIYGTNAAKKPCYAMLENGAQGATLGESGECAGEGLPTSKVNGLEVSTGGALRLMATAKTGGLLMFVSHDGGKSYAQTPVSAGDS